MAFSISPKKLDEVKIRTMSHYGAHLTWGEFARMLDVTPNTISNIRHGRTEGSVSTLKKIVSNLNKNGVEIEEKDLIVEDI